MNNINGKNKFSIFIVGYGAIGKIVSKFDHKALEKIYIYTGRSKVDFDNSNICSFHGELELILELKFLQNIDNLIVVYCSGPDKQDGYTKSSFIKDTYQIPSDFLVKLSAISSLNTKFIHISTMIGFDDSLVGKKMSSTHKININNDLYTEVKKNLDIFIENFKSANLSCVNLRISNLITADHITSQRKVLLRLAKQLINGESITLQKDTYLDMITETQLMSALKEEFFCTDSNVSKNVVNQKTFKLDNLFIKFASLTNNISSHGKIIISENKNLNNTIPKYLCSFSSVKRESLEVFAEELYRLVNIEI